VTEYLVGDTGVLTTLGYAALGGWLMYAMIRRQGKVPLRATQQDT
jgi:hypothetical protein